MVVTCNSFGVSGMDGYKVELEASMYNGTREFDMVGLPDAAVRESKDRVLSALKNCQTIRDKLGSQKGKSPDLQLRSQNVC